MRVVKIESLKPGDRFSHKYDDKPVHDDFPCVVIDTNMSSPMLSIVYGCMIVYCHIPTGTVTYSYVGYDVWVEN